MNAEEFAERINSPKRTGQQWAGLCPAHPDQRPSLSWCDGERRVLITCHKGCTFEEILSALGLKARDLRIKRAAPSTAASDAGLLRSQIAGERQGRALRISETYDYCNEHGQLLFQVARTAPKGFFQRRPAGGGGWVRGIQGVRRVVYRYPDLIEAVQRLPAGERLVVITEGEKDANSIWQLGIPATTNAMGAQKWSDDYSQQLAAVGIETVAIVPDNDAAGKLHADVVARSCVAAGILVKIVTLPDLRPKGDVTDWILDGNDAAAFWKVVHESPQVNAAGLAAVEPAPSTGTLESASPTAILSLSDVGNAERLMKKFGEEIRYTPAGWRVWDGARWAATSDGCEMMKRAIATVRAIRDEVRNMSAGDASALLRHARQSQMRSRLEGMIVVAQSLASERLAAFDADPYLLNVQNGTLDLRTGQLRPHRRDDLMTKIVPVSYDTGATAPAWEAFIKDVMLGDEKLARFLQRAVGYSLTGCTEEQALFMLFGDGANGKSTFLKIISEMSGDYGSHMAAETLMVKAHASIRNDLARLVGARFVTAVEVAEDRQLDETLVKQLTGGDAVTVRFLYKGHFDFTPAFKLFVAVNHLPVIRGTDNAIWRRIHLIPFGRRARGQGSAALLGSVAAGGR